MIKRFAFTGATPQEALKKAQEECGTEAIVIATKQIQEKTLTKKPIFEVIVGLEVKDEPKPQNDPRKIDEIKRQIQAYTNYSARPNLESEFTTTKPVNSDISLDLTNSQNRFSEQDLVEPKTEATKDDVSMNISLAAKEIQKIANIDESELKEQDYRHELNDVKKQMNKINDTLNILADAIWEGKATERDIAIPPEFATIYKLAKQSGMKSEHLKSIMEATIQNMPTAMKSNPVAVKRYFYSLLRKMLPCRKEALNSRRKKIMMLVGPTGVGKTTTLSKLAYKFAYGGDVRYKTGLITLDSYRIGAVEQLFQYASVMKLQMLEALNVDEFKNALKSLNSCDLILVDTVGSSQYDKDKLIKLNDFLKASEDEIDVNLVLSAGSKAEDLLEIYDNFSFLNIDTLIITKFDETKIFGNVFSLIYETGTPVSYFSIGQNVPDDIMEADSEFLVKCVLEGFDKGEGDGSSR